MGSFGDEMELPGPLDQNLIDVARRLAEADDRGGNWMQLRRKQGRPGYAAARGSLCKLWDAESKTTNNRYPAIGYPPGKATDYIQGWELWFKQRSQVSPMLGDCIGTPVSPDDPDCSLLVFDIQGHADPNIDTTGWKTVYHGTIPYAIQNILGCGLMASESEELGHGVLDNGNLAGVYTTPVWETGWGYAFPMLLFDNVRWQRTMFECLANPYKRNTKPIK